MELKQMNNVLILLMSLQLSMLLIAFVNFLDISQLLGLQLY